MARLMDYESVASQFDRRYQDYDYSTVEEHILKFISGATSKAILEVGCGSGHWLEVIAKQGYQVAGLDPSEAMLRLARQRLPKVPLIQGKAEAIPWPNGDFDRLFCINAFHHFTDREKFVTEAFRVLCPGGGFLTVGLNPHTGLDQWSIYDYWPETLQLDKERYLPTIKIRQMMRRHGFTKCRTFVARHILQSLPARETVEAGRLAQHVTSQLGILTNEEYNRGLHRLVQDIESAESKGITLKITSDLRLYATAGWK
ncbi:MAG: methyltransferase domain-containing protein [Chloroflexota bacterium]|nr:MAG: methyltransferase domain-containing protein [Chloroflexota bacterium]